MTGDAREDRQPGPRRAESAAPASRGKSNRPASRSMAGSIWTSRLAISSTQAVGRLKFLFNAKKAGHAGTLDPLASGVLPVAFGEATKTVPVVQDGAKSYRFRVRWGEESATDDAEGEIVARSDRRPAPAEIEGYPAALRRRYLTDAADLLRDPHRRRARLRSRTRRRNLRDRSAPDQRLPARH